ncbi:MAG: sulfatase-like hydrolase/transferase, partial [Bacteroidales bacterium]|nr:sulfatase-like hydrolase/transferase [Bacteroidales bacterium]
MNKNIEIPLIFGSIGLADIGAVTGCSSQKENGKRMNIVYIMCDDHSFQTISAYGHALSQLAPTPNIDRIAAQGIRFDRAYVENSLSTPSRACLMTGLYSHQNGQTMLSNVMDSTVTFIPELMHAAGYQTGFYGKWHMLCEPRGFDDYKMLRDQGEYFNPVFKSPDSNGQYIREEGYATDLITDHAIEFLENRDPDKPFLLYVHHKAPHRTWQPDLKYLELYEDIEFPLPETFYDDYSTRGAALQEQRMRIDEDMTMVGDLKLYGAEDPVPAYYLEMMEKMGIPTGARQARPQTRRSPRGLSSMTDEQLDVWYESYNRRNQAFFDKQDEMTHDEI